jgi:hypothetical protein
MFLWYAFIYEYMNNKFRCFCILWNFEFRVAVNLFFRVEFDWLVLDRYRVIFCFLQWNDGVHFIPTSLGLSLAKLKWVYAVMNWFRRGICGISFCDFSCSGKCCCWANIKRGENDINLESVRAVTC